MLTSDQLRVLINRHKEAVEYKSSWLTPFSVLVTLITTLWTADFKDFAGLKKETIEGAFITAALLALLYTARAIYRCWRYTKDADTETIVEEFITIGGTVVPSPPPIIIKTQQSQTP